MTRQLPLLAGEPPAVARVRTRRPPWLMPGRMIAREGRELVEFERIGGTARRYYRLIVQPSRQLALVDDAPRFELVVVYGRIDVSARRRVEPPRDLAAIERRWTQLAGIRLAHDYVMVTR